VLAEKLGMTVSQLEAEMSVDEFIEWSVFFTMQDEDYKRSRKEAMNGKPNRQSRI
tara:strand:+ start:1128 stop:1292 length:165 start_codon:yes stop_codon:yes gene_type:complete